MPLCPLRGAATLPTVMGIPRAKSFDELAYVDWLQRTELRRGPVRLGIGDDMACVRHEGGELLVASDMLLDGVHFDTSRHSLRLIGRKALACNLSDCAAMAVQPIAATVSLALPKAFTLQNARALHRGMADMAGRFDISVVGGDTTCWSHPLAIDVTILARPYKGLRPVLRSGGRPGDRLYVTGRLGGSILGSHLRFEPRIAEAQRLSRALGTRLHAMMDISDGLLLDLHRLCRASGVGAALVEADLERIISPSARRLARQTGRAALDYAWSDGEDFELLLAVRGDVTQDEVSGVTLLPIGTLTRRGFVLERRNGQVSRLQPRGYVHR
ncbi:MAG: thiamine-phosphate kinase [Phycisphaerales bacterium]|nr:thiamine-phosphate kinase [Phycisphaerales bacterium]